MCQTGFPALACHSRGLSVTLDAELELLHPGAHNGFPLAEMLAGGHAAPGSSTPKAPFTDSRQRSGTCDRKGLEPQVTP